MLRLKLNTYLQGSKVILSACIWDDWMVNSNRFMLQVPIIHLFHLVMLLQVLQWPPIDDNAMEMRSICSLLDSCYDYY